MKSIITKAEGNQGNVIFMDFVLRSTGKAIGEHGIKWEGKIFLDLDYADDLSILDEIVSIMNELLEVFRV